MIRVVRGPEPAVLRDIRDRQLTHLRDLIAREKRDPLSTEIKGYGHADVRAALWKAQQHKCCYCEKDIELTYEDVEHYRPKAEADRQPGCTATHGYWWMAFTWENLLYACPQCNEGKKRTKFPLAAGSVALLAEQAPPGQEVPLLIDPADESGVRHIEFRPERRGRRDYWIPEPRNGSPHGKWTINVCGLDRDPLLDRYRKHVEYDVMRYVDELRAAMRQAAPDEAGQRGVYSAYHRTCRALLSPAQRFIGLSYDALVHFTGEALRKWDFSWPMPS